MSRTPMVRRSTALAALVAALASIPTPATAWPVLDHSVPDEVAQFYDPSVVRSIQLTMLPADFDRIRRDRTFSVEVPATITIDGTTLPAPVSVRRKSGYALPTDRDPRRVAFKVTLDEFDEDQEWMEVTKLSLEGAKYSPVYEGLAWLLHQAASTALGYGVGYDAALANWANVSVNGEGLGLYLNVEDRGKRFLKNRDSYVSGQSWLYKRGPDETELDVGSGASPTIAVLCFDPFRVPGGPSCTTPDDATVASLLQTHVEMPTLLTMWAIDSFICNWDSMLGFNNNHYFLDATYTDAPGRRYYPWDMDRGFERKDCSPFGVKGRVTRRGVNQSAAETLLLNNPTIRIAYRDLYYALLADGGPLSVASLEAMVADVRALLVPHMLADPYRASLYGGRRTMPDSYLDGIRTYLLYRRALVVAQLDANLPAPRAG